jgi:MFS family permease
MIAAPGAVALLLGTAQALAWATTFYLPAVLAPIAGEELAASPVVIHAAFSLALLIAGLSAPATGHAIEARGGRAVLMASSCVMAAGLAMLGLLPGLSGWFVGWAVLGFGMALGLYEAAFATLGTLFGQSARRPITSVTLVAGFASTLGWPTTAALLPELGWRGTCLAYAALHLSAILPLYAALPRDPPPEPKPEKAPAVGTRHDAGPVAPGAAWARRALLLLAAFFTVRAFLSATMAVHVITLMGGLGLAAVAAVQVAALQGPAQVAGRLLELTLARRTHPLTVARAGAVLLPVGVAGVLVAGPAAAAGFMVCYGVSNGILTISRGAVPLALFGARGYPVRMGRLALPILLAQAAAPVVTAPLMSAFSATTILAAGGVLALLAMLCLLPLRMPSRPLDG